MNSAGHRFWARLLPIALILCGGLACPGQEGLSLAQRQQITHKAQAVFAQADFFKPLENQSGELAEKLAPLFMVEVGKTNRTLSDFSGQEFETLVLSNSTVRVRPSARPVLYWQLDTATVAGQVHGRLTWFWFPGGASNSPGSDAAAFQAVRMTLDRQGAPVLWEAWDSRWAPRILFVAQSLEQAAQTRYGKPLAGRSLAIEPSLEAAPELVVARVLEDGPVPMGPVIYLEASGQTISTLLCRCMPPQTKEVLHTSVFELKALPLVSENPQFGEFLRGLASGWPGPGQNVPPLRWPAAF